MALNWRLRRQLIYIGVPVLLVILVVSYLVFASLSRPTCYDGIQNQGERGIDCEGPCPQVCLERVIDLDVVYARALMTQPGVYNLVAKIENRNHDLALLNQEVIFKLYSEQGELIGEHSGNFDIRNSNTTLAFIGPVQLETEPRQVVLEFADFDWEISSANPPYIEVVSQSLINPNAAPRLEVLLRNNELDAFRQVPVVAVVEDRNANLIATSRTFVDLPDLREVEAIFTWPRPFPQVLQECRLPLDSVLITSDNLDSDQVNSLEAVLGQGDDRVGVTLSFSVEESSEEETGLNQVIDAALSTLLEHNSPQRKAAIILVTNQSDDLPLNSQELNLRSTELLNNFGINLHTVTLGSDFELGEFVSQIAQIPQLEEVKKPLSAGVCEVTSYSTEIFPQPSWR